MKDHVYITRKKNWKDQSQSSGDVITVKEFTDFVKLHKKMVLVETPIDKENVAVASFVPSDVETSRVLGVVVILEDGVIKTTLSTPTREMPDFISELAAAFNATVQDEDGKMMLRYGRQHSTNMTPIVYVILAILIALVVVYLFAGKG